MLVRLPLIFGRLRNKARRRCRLFGYDNFQNAEFALRGDALCISWWYRSIMITIPRHRDQHSAAR